MRGALLGLYSQVGADPDRPQDVSRRLGLNKNLTWKISRVLQAEDAFEALPLLPGMAGLDLVLEATEKAGADAAALQRTRLAIAEIEAMVATHGGDRATMDLMLDSMAETGLEKSRKLAFRGNAGIWGVMAKARVSAQVLAPNADDPNMLDVMLIAGLQKVRRFRPIPRWPVFRLGRYEFEGQVQRFAVEEAPEAPWGFLPSFSRGPMPEIHVREDGDEVTYEVGDGPVGKTGEFGCYFGFGYRADVPRYRTKPDETAWLAAAVSMPVETLLFDLFVHKDMPEALQAETSIYGGAWQNTPQFPPSAKLPINDRPVHLGRGADVSTPLADQYAEVMRLSFERAGWSAEDFHCLRLVVEHPPMPSRAVIRYPLLERPVR
ncbi:hypothetical protein AY599_24875 [Leptolyngbya valderiana BDU 20041]|nr:hypothetical protein AY599_24875 [Leptolyngbya valderiana BDU 20041]